MVCITVCAKLRMICTLSETITYPLKGGSMTRARLTLDHVRNGYKLLKKMGI